MNIQNNKYYSENIKPSNDNPEPSNKELNKEKKEVTFSSPSKEILNPSKIQQLKAKVASLVWQGVGFKDSPWYQAQAEEHLAWMETIGGERMMVGQEGEKIDTMFFSTEVFTKKLEGLGGKYAILSTPRGEINGFAFDQNKSSTEQINHLLEGIQGRNDQRYGFFSSGWNIQKVDDKLVIFPKQFDAKGELQNIDITSIKTLDQDLSFKTNKTVVIAPGILTLYEIYDDILGEVPAFLQQGINVVLFNYRGYGQSEGLPSEKALDQDLEQLLQYLKEQKGIKDEDLILKGVCLGGGPISRAALNHPQATVILDQTFADTDTFIDTLVKKQLGTLISVEGNKAEYVEKIVAAVGRSIFPHYNNSEVISKMKNNLCLIINNNDEMIPEMGKAGKNADENTKNIGSLPENTGQVTSIVFLDSIGHAQGWYRDSSIKKDQKLVQNLGLSQMHDFLRKVGYSHDITEPATVKRTSTSLQLIRQFERLQLESQDLLKKFTSLENLLAESNESIFSSFFLPYSSYDELNRLVKQLKILNENIDNYAKQIEDYNNNSSNSTVNKEIIDRLKSNDLKLKAIQNNLNEAINKADQYLK